MLTVQYNTQEEREQILAKHSDKYLIEEQNIAEGNFLVFSDKPNTELIPVNITKDDYDKLSSSVADLWETFLMGGSV